MSLKMEDTVKNRTYPKRPFAWYVEKPSAKDYLLTVFIFAVCTLIGLLFQKLDLTDTNIVTIYILGVLITSIVTDGYLCSVAGSFLSVFLFCFFLMEPRMSFETYAVGYPVTFFIMLISSVLTGALAAKLKTHAKLSTQLAFRAQILFDTDRLLQKAKGETEILDVTCTQLLRLLNRNITAYVVENGTLSEGKLFSGEKEDTEDFLIPEEQQIAKWVCENRQHAGASTHHFPQAKCLYLAIRSGDNVYGVIGIPLQKETLDTFEYSILLSVINECALAMENAKNALEKEKNAVMAKNEQLRADLLRAISHDLRTPLCSISGNADMLLGNSDRLDEATKHQIYSDIYDDSEWLIGVVENLLSITRLNDGRLKFKFTDQLLDEVIAESLRHISRKHDDYKIMTDCEELVLVRMDVQLIIQVLVNLIDNAIKYTQEGGEIQLLAEECESNSSVYAKYRFLVSDNGMGMSADFKDTIFDPFTRAENSLTSKIQGTGLGMAITRNLVEAMGGTIDVESELGQGSCFEVLLDLKIAEDRTVALAAQEETDEQDGNILQGMKFLCAEDNELNSEITTVQLEEFGMNVERAVDGKNAVEIFRNHPEGTFDVILMDIMMPEMNGYEAAKAIRTMNDRPDGKNIPIIAMTANSFGEDVQASLDAGMNAHLSKPIVIEEVIKTILRYVHND